MNFDERVATVARLTAASAESPRLYRLRVLFWIVLGYVLVGSLILAAIALSVAGVAAVVVSKQVVLVKFAWIPIAFAWMLVRSLFVRIAPPPGRVLRRREVPKLFALVDDIRNRAGVRRLDRILLVGDMNAAVVEMPRFGGLFGWRRDLLLGLPLLLSHSTEEMRAILGHELGHLSGKHGRTAAWSWRVRETWTRILSSGSARGWMRGLFAWYADHLMATTLVQARAHELEADRFAAEITSPATAARALAWHRVADRLMEKRFWERLWESVDERPTAPPPLDLFVRQRAEIFAPPFDDIFDEELARLTSVDDSHPALRERLQRLGTPRPAIGFEGAPAVDELFGRSAAAFIAEFDREWTQNFAPVWQQRRKTLEEARAKLAEAADVDPATLDEERLHARAASLAELGNDTEAYALYAALAERNPKDAIAAFHVGRLLLARQDLAGIRHLSEAMQLDWRFVAPACELAYTALRNKGLDREADAWGERYRQHCELVEASRVESLRLEATDVLEPTALDVETQGAILAKCAEHRWIGAVWIARKKRRTLPDDVEFVAVRPKRFTYIGKRFGKLVAEMNFERPLILFLVTNRALCRHLDRVPGARRM